MMSEQREVLDDGVGHWQAASASASALRLLPKRLVGQVAKRREEVEATM